MEAEVDILNITIKEKEDWDIALQGSNVSVYSTWQYCNIIGQNYSEDISLLKISSGASGMIAVYTSRSKDGEYKDIYSPYGMGGVYFWGEDTVEIIIIFEKWLREHKIVTYFLMLHPKDVLSNNNYIEQYRAVYKLSVNEPNTNIWKKIHSNHKYEINKYCNNVEFGLIEDKTVLKPFFKELYFNTLKRVNAAETYYFSDTTLDLLFNSDITIGLGLKVGNEINCVVIFLKYNNWAEYYINASTIEGRAASRLLLWEMFKRLKEQGISLINLGGGVTDGDYLDDFKRRFGGDQVNIGLFKGISMQEEYNRLCEENGLSLTDKYFPPYWRK